MAETSTTFTPPASTAGTELYYAVTEDTALIQVFGNQSIPTVDTPPEDVTYRTLESSTEFAVPGVKPFESIEIENMYYPEQFNAIRAVAESGKEPYWYIKLPNVTAGATSGAKPLCIKWRGAVKITFSEIALDDMIKTTLKIYKSTVPEFIEGLPSTSI